jgi:hypothetical protein
MTRELPTTLDASGIEWPALRNHIPCRAYVIELALGAFMSSLGANGRTKCWETHEHNQQFRQNESTDNGKSQRPRKQSNPSINEMSAMRPGWAKIIENVRISTYFESAETERFIAENASCNNYADTCLSIRVPSLSNSKSSDSSTTHSGCEDNLELDTGVARAPLTITCIHTQVASTPKTQRLPATLHNTGWVDNCQVYHTSLTAIPVLDPIDVERAHH